MTRTAALLVALLMSGCSTVPAPEMLSGAVTCVNVETLAARTTTVYLSPQDGVSVAVRPDCTVVVTWENAERSGYGRPGK